MPHRKTAGDNRLDARLESNLGRLYFEGMITEAEYDAGTRFGWLVLEYLESIAAPSPYGSDLLNLSDEECLKRANCMAARKALKEGAGACALVAVDRIAVYDEKLREGELRALRAGLRALCGMD